ncbi:MAG: hypothetical protein EOO24_21485 [Comamonadaceae bacterium]|nr:MAG: hypothetical protein EOO24_21485 [Comamonadaceae bacterium]
MPDLVRRPVPPSVFVTDPDARKTAKDEEFDASTPGKDENAAGFLKNAIDQAGAEAGAKESDA